MINSKHFGIIVIVVLVCGSVFAHPSVYLGSEPDKVCEPRLMRVSGGVASHPCDRSVRCVGNVCIGSEHGAANYEALDQAGVTHIISAIGMCAQRRDKHRPCLNLELEDTSAEYGMVAALRRTRLWRESQRTATCTASRCGTAHFVRVFVHCAAGVSRSSTLAIGLMLEDDPTLTYDNALARLREARNVVRPNQLFELTLRLAAELGVGSETECALNRILQTSPAAPCSPSTCLVADRIAAEHNNK